MLGDANYIFIDRRPSEPRLSDFYAEQWAALGLQIVEETPNYQLLKLPDAR